MINTLNMPAHGDYVYRVMAKKFIKKCKKRTTLPVGNREKQILLL